MFKTATTHTTNARSSNGFLFQKETGDSAFIQPKLNIGKPGDKYEVEADRVADRVVAKTSESNTSFFSPAPLVQKQQKEEEEIQKQPEEVQKKEAIAETITPVVLRNPEEETVQNNTEVEVQNKTEVSDSISMKLSDHSSSNLDTQKQEEEGQESEEEVEVTEVQQKTKILQRKETGVPTVTNSIESRIQKASGGGKPMSKNVKKPMESGFGADFSNVNIHTNQESTSLNNQISSKAFTYKNNIFFNQGQYQPETNTGKHLLAHELTHVVQQGHAVRRKPEISTESAKPQIQRFGFNTNPLDWFAEKANNLMGFRMFTIVLGVNPINMSSVDRSAANIMRAIVEFLPGGKLITDALDKYDVFTDAADLMKETLDGLSITGKSIKKNVDTFIADFGITDLADPVGLWNDAKSIITGPIDSIIELGKNAVAGIYKIVKKAILTPLAILAKDTNGYDLLTVVLGEDPITKEAVQPTAENVIGGFMKFIGQEEIWKNIQEGNAISRAWEWFQEAMSGIKTIVSSIPGTIVDTIKSLTWEDIIVLPNVFIKIGKAFVSIATDFMSWGLGTVIELLKILFSVVAPGVLPYIEKAQGAFNKILKDPISFVGNLVKAAKLGFEKFAANIGIHLKNSLLNWLMGSLASAGIYIPQALNFKEIFKFIASVLGLSWAKLRIKLVKHLGEPAVKAMEVGFELVQILVTEGPAAAWEKIMEHLTNLKSLVIQEISQFVIVKVVQKAIAKLVLMLNPAGAVIEAIISIYTTITFLIEKIKQIARVGAAIIDSISAIANGVLGAAIKKVEKTLAGMLTLAINFLAKYAGLDKIANVILKIVRKLQAKVDEGIDFLITWIIEKAKSFLKKAVQTGAPKDPKERLEVGLSKAVNLVNRLGESAIGIKLITPILIGVKARYGFEYLRATEEGGFWAIEGKVNPSGKKKTQKQIKKENIEKLEQDIINYLNGKGKYLKLGPFATPNSYISSTSSGFTTTEQNKINEKGRRYGGHFEGNKTLPRYTPDHQPASKLTDYADANPFAKKVLKKGGVKVGFRTVRLYPQDPKFNRRQGGATRGVLQKLEKLKRVIES